MSRAGEELYEAGMQLPPDARRRVALRMLATLHADEHQDAKTRASQVAESLDAGEHPSAPDRL